MKMLGVLLGISLAEILLAADRVVSGAEALARFFGIAILDLVRDAARVIVAILVVLFGGLGIGALVESVF